MQIDNPGPHLDHMLRQTRDHHAQLSSMADVKANLLLTMASLVMTLTAPLLLESRLRFAAMVLMGFCGLTILLGAYAVMPKNRRREPGQNPDVDDPSFNILFFGDFVGMDYASYRKQMEKVLSDPNRTYEVMVREIYTYGQYLASEKYRWLRMAYLAFLTGVMATLIISFVVMLNHTPQG